jgi:hypothetical protein
VATRRRQWAIFSSKRNSELFQPALERIAQWPPDKIQKLLEPGALENLLGKALHDVVPGTSAKILKGLKADAPRMRLEPTP